jgi:hypothetical protein
MDRDPTSIRPNSIQPKLRFFMLVIAKDHPGIPRLELLARCESVCGRSAEVSLANPTLLNKNLVLAIIPGTET